MLANARGGARGQPGGAWSCSGSWNPQQLRPRLPLLIPHQASLNQPQPSSCHGAWCLQPSPRQQNHGDAAPVSILTQWSRNHPLGPRTTFVVSSLQNTRMPLPRRGRLCCQLWEKTARVAIYTLNCKLGKNSTSSLVQLQTPLQKEIISGREDFPPHPQI